jgi:hypothetical protein
MPTKLRKLKITRVAVCQQGANYDEETGEGAHILLFKSQEQPLDKAERSAAGTNDLPDSAFAYVESGGSKDADGKTVPRSLRHLPYRTASGAIDKPHLRNALARLSQTDIPASAKASAKKKLTAAARSAGIEVSDDEDTAKQAGPDPTPVTPSSMPPIGLTATRRRKRPTHKQDFSGPGHPEPDGDETPPMDYATRSRQQDLWGALWDKWSQFSSTYYDVVGDCDEDNVAYLPILVDSIGQFGDDVQSLLRELGVVEKVAPALDACLTIAKAGAPMAGHRLTRLKAAIDQLQQILDECTPATIDHPGVSAADVRGIPGVMKGAPPMAVRKNAESDKEHCENCDDEDCDNPAHDRMKKAEEDRMEALKAMTARAEKAEARLTEVEAALAKSVQDLAALQDEMAIAKMSPEEQREAFLTSMPELVKKRYLDQELRLELIEKTNRELHEKNERLDYIQKTAAFRGLGFVPDDHWEVFKAIDQMPEAPRTDLVRLLTAATEQLRTSDLFKAHGTPGFQPGVESSSAEAQLLALAKAYSDDKGVSMGQAIDAVAKQHPDLWERNSAEKRRTNRVASAPGV